MVFSIKRNIEKEEIKLKILAVGAHLDDISVVTAIVDTVIDDARDDQRDEQLECGLQEFEQWAKDTFFSKATHILQDLFQNAHLFIRW